MAKLVNRAKMTTPTTGTGTITLGSAVDGYQTFADAGVSNADVVRYVIEDGNNWEIGTGTYSVFGTTLTRTVLESSNADAAISLTGSAEVFVTAVTEDIVQLDLAQTLTNKTLTTPGISTPTMTGTIVEDVYDVSLSGFESHTLEPDNGSVQIHAVSNDMTYLDGFSSGEAITLLINTTSSDGIVWPTITWVNNGGIAPTIPVTGGPVTIALWKAGTTLYGALVGDGS